MAEMMETMRPRGMRHMMRTMDARIKEIPPDTYVTAAAGSVAVSLVMRLMGFREMSNFVGQWAPMLMVLAIYDRLTD